jgi:predicted nucleotide-binding protein
MVVRPHATYVARNTRNDGTFAKALEDVQERLKGVRRPAAIVVAGRKFESTTIGKVHELLGQRLDLERIRGLKDAIFNLLRDPNADVSEELAASLRRAKDHAEEIIAYCDNHHASACNLLLEMAENRSDSLQAILLGSELGRFTAVDVQEASKYILAELESIDQPQSPKKTEKKRQPQVTKRQQTAMKKHVFIGHGRSLVWMQLRYFLERKLNLVVDEFNSDSVAGKTTIEVLKEKLESACFAFLLHTAEDEVKSGEMRARANVIHETGLFQGRLGFEKAIVLLEDGCSEFSNIHGLSQIRFAKGDVEAKFEAIRDVLIRERVLGNVGPNAASSVARKQAVAPPAELSQDEILYLMALSRPRNDGKISTNYFDKFPSRETERYREMMLRFENLQYVRAGLEVYVMTSKGRSVADRYWELHLLRCIAGKDREVTITELKTLAKLSQGDEADEIRRHLERLKADGSINTHSRGDGELIVAITPTGRKKSEVDANLDFSSLQL